MLKMFVGDVWTYLQGESAFGLIDSVTSYQIHGRWHSQAYQKRQWDGVKRFRHYDRSKGQYRIATGFLSRITERLDKADYPYELYDDRDFCPPDPVLELANGIKLDQGIYDYQATAVEAACMHGRGVFHIATGGGKTIAGAGIIKSFGVKTIWLTHRKALFYQAHRVLEKTLGQQVGLLGDGKRDYQDVTVAMVQTIDVSRKDQQEILEHLSDVELIVLDEVHNAASSRQWIDTLNKIPAPHRFGLTATPCFKGPGLALVGIAGDVIFHIGPKELIDRGVLVPPKIWICRHGAKKIPASAKFPTAYSQGITKSKERNGTILQIVRLLREDQKRGLTLVKQIGHGNTLADLMCQAGIRTEFINGKVDQATRDLWVDQLRIGELDHLVAVAEIMGEGVDIPFLEAVINATGTRGGGSAQSGVEHEVGRVTTQFLGRGLRRHPGKKFFEYFDFADTHHKFLAKAAKARIETLEEQGYAHLIKYLAERE